MRKALLLAGCALVSATLAREGHAKGPADAYHGRGSANVLWFMHVSDAHVGKSSVEDPTGQYLPHFQKALNEIWPVLRPAFVIMSGDLTDASNGAIPTSGQQQDEWDTYKAVCSGAGMKPAFYFDLPGNHDAYGESNGLSYFLKNSVQGPVQGVPYLSWTVQIPDGEMLFFGLNSRGLGAAPMTNPAPEYTDDELDYVEQTLSSHKDARLVVVSAHDVLEDSVNVARLESAMVSAGGGYYLHGHRHEYSEYLGVGGKVVVNEIGGLGKMDQDNIGVVAIDHGGLVYGATAVEQPWPFVMITAPMARQLRNGGLHPYAYKVCKDRHDNPVRALVFSDIPVTGVVAQIGTSAASAMTASAPSSPLFEGEVDTSAVAAGPQQVTVTAKFGSQQVSHTIEAELVEGPCEALPIDGAGGASGDAGADAAAGQAGNAGAGGKSDAGAGYDAAGGTADAAPEAALGGESAPARGDGGCSCRGANPGPATGAFWLLLTACVAAGRRRSLCGSKVGVCFGETRK